MNQNTAIKIEDLHAHTFAESSYRLNETTFRRLGLDDLVNKKLTEHEVLIAETAYRRGYHQGFLCAAQDAEDGIHPETLVQFAHLKLASWRMKKHCGQIQFPPCLVKKKTNISAKENTTLQKMSEVLKTTAWGYGTAIFQHFDIDSQDFDKEAFEYIFAQCDFVKCHSKNVAVELFRLGVKQVELKHLQYFYSIEPPVFSPYMHLWKWCFDQMAEIGLLPPNSAATLDRFINNKERRRPFTKS